jgi:VanZ family protein
MVFLSSWLPVFVWAGFIYYLSSIPSLNTGWGLWDFILRKIAHMAEFGILTLLLVRAWRRSISMLAPSGLLVISALFALLYAVSDEFHQSFVPGRGPSVVDVLIDACGIMAAMCVAYFNLRRIHEK